MATPTRPGNWKRIERNIKLRAEHRCECGTFMECRSNDHYKRCPNVEGNRYQHNKRLIKLRIAQTGAADDWRPNVLVALCLPCHQRYTEIRAEQARQRENTKALEAQMDTLW